LIVWSVLCLSVLALLLFSVSWIATRVVEHRYQPTGRFVDVEGVRVHLVEWGKPDAARPSLLFVHGASSNHREFMLAMGAGIGAQLHPDQHCLFVDRPGQGASERRAGDHSPRVQADRLMAAARACGAEQCIVVGHSWGGSVVAQMAVHHQDTVYGAMFAAPATHPWKGGGWGGVDWYYGIACLPVIGWLFTRLIALPAGWFQIEAGVENVFSPETPTPGYAQGLGARLVLRPASFRANARDVFCLRPFVRREAASYACIACPVHIITGDEDAVVWPHVHADGLERDIGGARKHVISGGGHMPHHTQAPLMLDLIASMIAGEQVQRPN
jgi:pimeloyl-ACP methyl ester carboxylesterase